MNQPPSSAPVSESAHPEEKSNVDFEDERREKDRESNSGDDSAADHGSELAPEDREDGDEDEDGEENSEEEEAAGQRRFYCPLSAEQQCLAVSYAQLLTERNRPPPAADSDAATGPPADEDDEWALAGGGAVGQSNRFTGVIARIERMTAGQDDYRGGYDAEDSFIDDTELQGPEDTPRPALSYDGFFIYKFTPGEAGAPAPPLPPLPTKRKRPPAEVPPRPALAEPNAADASPPGKRRGKRAYEIPQAVQKALTDIEQLAKELGVEPPAPGKRPRMPPQLHLPLARLGALASSLHPQGHIASSILDAIVKVLPFHQMTIRSFLKPERNPEDIISMSATLAAPASVSPLRKLQRLVRDQMEAQKAANPNDPVFQWQPETEIQLFQALRSAYEELHRTNTQRKLENLPPFTEDANLKSLLDEILNFWETGWMTREELEKVYKKKAHAEAKRRKKEKEAKKQQRAQEALQANAAVSVQSVDS